MKERSTTHKPTKSLQLARQLAEQGFRLFSLREARQVNELSSLEIKDVKQTLGFLKYQDWIQYIPLLVSRMLYENTQINDVTHDHWKFTKYTIICFKRSLK